MEYDDDDADDVWALQNSLFSSSFLTLDFFKVTEAYRQKKKNVSFHVSSLINKWKQSVLKKRKTTRIWSANISYVLVRHLKISSAYHEPWPLFRYLKYVFIWGKKQDADCHRFIIELMKIFVRRSVRKVVVNLREHSDSVVKVDNAHRSILKRIEEQVFSREREIFKYLLMDELTGFLRVRLLRDR